MANNKNLPVGLEWLADEAEAERAAIAAREGTRVQELRARQSEQRRVARARAEGTYRDPNAIVVPWLDELEAFVATVNS